MTDKINNDPDSLVDALESIKSLLAKSDSKLAAARESIAIASNQTPLGHLESEEFDIPILHDVVNPSDVESVTEEVSNISEQLSSKIDETLAAVHENIPNLSETVSAPDPQVMLDYLDTLQEKLEKTLRDSLMKSIVTIEAGLKKSLTAEINKIRKQIKKDFK
jgi:ABC-type transporter Mla subunit MlaD